MIIWKMNYIKGDKKMRYNLLSAQVASIGLRQNRGGGIIDIPIGAKTNIKPSYSYGFDNR